MENSNIKRNRQYVLKGVCVICLEFPCTWVCYNCHLHWFLFTFITFCFLQMQ